MPTHALRAAGVSVLVAVAGAARADAPPVDLATYPRAALEIVQHASDSVRRFHFDVWVADTPARAEQGLMYVRDLPPERGMIFVFTPAQVVTFWMKNTYIPLDLLFIAGDGRVAKIIERAPPLRLDPLSSEVPVETVLELRGGEAGLLGLRVGDQVSWQRVKRVSVP
jgi:hypothetical protein